MARNPAAIWDPLPSSSGGAFTGGPKKGVAHKVQGDSYAGARATYVSRSLGPHFTIAEDGALYQHLDTGVASSAVANDSGGVQTNRDGAIQVEVVGFSGRSASPAQLATFVQLQIWLHANEGIPPVWPAGRPPTSAQDGYGKNNGHRNAALWDSTGGWYGHSQVPENTHWDPAWTDDEWNFINREDDMYDQKARDELIGRIDEMRATLGDLAAIKNYVVSIQQTVSGDQVDEGEIARQVLAGLDPDAIAAAIPDGLARQVADELHKRLAG